VAATTNQRASSAELPNVSRIRQAAARPWPDTRHVQRCPCSGKCRLVRDSILCRYGLGRDTWCVFPLSRGARSKRSGLVTSGWCELPNSLARNDEVDRLQTKMTPGRNRETGQKSRNGTMCAYGLDQTNARNDAAKPNLSKRTWQNDRSAYDSRNLCRTRVCFLHRTLSNRLSLNRGGAANFLLQQQHTVE
jgi:hypothetical protein